MRIRTDHVSPQRSQFSPRPEAARPRVVQDTFGSSVPLAEGPDSATIPFRNEDPKPLPGSELLQTGNEELPSLPCQPAPGFGGMFPSELDDWIIRP